MWRSSWIAKNRKTLASISQRLMRNSHKGINSVNESRVVVWIFRFVQRSNVALSFSGNLGRKPKSSTEALGLSRRLSGLPVEKGDMKELQVQSSNVNSNYIRPTRSLRRRLVMEPSFAGNPSVGLAWYIEGALIPELYLRRGLTYSFRVHGGNNPHSANLYHPLIITDEPHGGYDTLSDLAQSKVRVLAGVELTRRGRPRPTAGRYTREKKLWIYSPGIFSFFYPSCYFSVGPLCLSKHNGRDRRLDDNFPSFKKFNRTLMQVCESGKSCFLQISTICSVLFVKWTFENVVSEV